MKLKEEIECKFLRNKAGALCLRRRRRSLRRAGGIKGQKLTKEKVLEYMNSTEVKEALKKISAGRANKLLNRIDLYDAHPNEIVDAFIEYFNNQTNFNRIFK